MNVDVDVDVDVGAVYAIRLNKTDRDGGGWVEGEREREREMGNGPEKLARAQAVRRGKDGGDGGGCRLISHPRTTAAASRSCGRRSGPGRELSMRYPPMPSSSCLSLPPRPPVFAVRG